MKEVSILLSHPSGPLHGDIIGVERGAVYCANNNLQMSIACGDFDSVTPKEKELIKTFTSKFIELDPIKDLTDFEYALSLCTEYDRIYVYGALGRRLDHELVNLFLAYQDPRIILLDDKNRISSYPEGTYSFAKGEYTYFSILPFKEAIISLEGFKYPLDYQHIKPLDTYLSSNEIIDTGILSVHEGHVLLVESRDS